MQNIPLQALPSQTVSIQLNSQNCQINVYQTNNFGMFLDLYVAGTAIITGVSCQNLTRIVRDAYLGFSGDLIWYDTSGAGTDPSYTGVGSQYTLTYLAPADLDGYA